MRHRFNYRESKRKDPEYLRKLNEKSRRRKNQPGVREAYNKRAREIHAYKMETDPEYAMGKEISRLKWLAKKEGRDPEIDEHLLEYLKDRFERRQDVLFGEQTRNIKEKDESVTNGESTTIQSLERRNFSDGGTDIMNNEKIILPTKSNGSYATQINTESSQEDLMRSDSEKLKRIVKISTGRSPSLEVAELLPMDLIDECGNISLRALKMFAKEFEARGLNRDGADIKNYVESLTKLSQQVIEAAKTKIAAIRVACGP